MPSWAVEVIKIGGTATVTLMLSFATYLVIDRLRLERTHKQKVVELMVEKIHEYGMGMYLPLVGRLNTLDRALKELLIINSREQKERCLWRLARYLSFQRTLPGMFLSNLTAERVTAYMGDEIYNHLTASHYLSPDQIIFVSTHTDTDQSLESFRKRIDKQPWKAICQNFTEWLNERDEVESLRRHVRCYSHVVLQDLNISHQAWYGEMDKSLVDDDINLIRNALGKDEVGIDPKAARKFLRTWQRYVVGQQPTRPPWRLLVVPPWYFLKWWDMKRGQTKTTAAHRRGVP